MVAVGWNCFVLSPSARLEDWTEGGIQLEQLDAGETHWSASGPSGEHVGSLATVLAAAADPRLDSCSRP